MKITKILKQTGWHNLFALLVMIISLGMSIYANRINLQTEKVIVKYMYRNDSVVLGLKKNNDAILDTLDVFRSKDELLESKVDSLNDLVHILQASPIESRYTQAR